MGKQILKIAVQRGISRIAFTHGQQLDELWMAPMAPKPVAYEYNPDTEELRYIEAVIGEDSIANNPKGAEEKDLKLLRSSFDKQKRPQ